MDYRQEYQRWLERVTDGELLEELRHMDEAAIEDAFYRNLAFGTGGLRGIIGAGINRMNIYTVALPLLPPSLAMTAALKATCLLGWQQTCLLQMA